MMTVETIYDGAQTLLNLHGYVILLFAIEELLKTR